ncbi:MAG: hypothetical protein KIS79_14355 [Burkholderiales bacterium]|nr:hypothetical protein [Burkholderiales bacterium]
MARQPVASPAPLLAAAQPRADSDVIFDVEIERGMLHFVLANIGTAPAHAVRVKLDKAVRDPAGQRVNDNPLYSSLEFLAPGRRVRLLIDSLIGYIERRQPMKLAVKLQWSGDDGQVLQRSITHDLSAWTQLREPL